ncbi:CHRD domain-containing protein [Accumulibacter sp.]|uniref:CHRD domain-containing protein n=1 Tax=Accumulibacter sp. TaxID=2053492 RepID=UPI0028C3CA7F|nr:CHRD domain-containing protein [Accumulibacter sp.]
MNASKKPPAYLRTLAAALLLGAVGTAASADEVRVMLWGTNEIPPVTTSASGGGMIVVGDDGAVSGSVSTTGVVGTAAHIHQGAARHSGPVIVPLVKDGDTYKVPPGARLTAEQVASFKAGELYINVHSAANPGGEIRGQLQ